VWIQQSDRDRQGLRWRGKGELPPAALAIDSPYDPDAGYGINRGVGWRGDKAHFTETCEPDRPHPGRARGDYGGHHHRRGDHASSSC
jgi:hypothetical protein